MKNLPANIVIEKNKLATASAWLVLLDVTLTDNTVFRLVRNNEDITFNGNVYTAFNFELEPTEQGNSGEIPSVTLRVSNITRLIESKLQDLDGGIGSTVKVTVVNSDLLAESYSELEMTFDVLACNTTSQWVVFTLGAPSPLRQRFPLDKYLALHCRFRFNRPSGNYPECGYSGESIEGITLPSGSPVSINIIGHPFTTGDVVSFLDVGGTTELNSNSYTVTKTDDDNFTLDSTDGDNFTAWTSGGTAGFATCKRTLSDCRIRANSVRFGGFPGMRSGGIRIA
jgi:phage-related protein